MSGQRCPLDENGDQIGADDSARKNPEAEMSCELAEPPEPRERAGNCGRPANFAKWRANFSGKASAENFRHRRSEQVRIGVFMALKKQNQKNQAVDVRESRCTGRRQVYQVFLVVVFCI